jgi:ABC-type transport system substrate-binding protein
VTPARPQPIDRKDTIMLRRTALSLLSGAAIAPLAGWRDAIAQAAPGRPLTYGQSTRVTALDPAQGAFATYPGGYEVGYCMFDRLVDFDADLRIVPGLATRWEVAADVMSVRFTLRKGVTFHDGTAFDAAAVKFNVERLMDRERTPTNRPLWDVVAGVEVVDAETVVVRTKAPFSQIVNSFAHGSGSIVSPASVARHGEKGVAQNPVGAGPFMLESFVPGQEVVLKAFPGYWGGRPATERLAFKFIAEAATRVAALRTGSVDIVDSVPVQLVAGLRREAGIDVIARPGLRPLGLAINLSAAPFDDVRVRQALNHAVPVRQIAERVFFGFAKASDSPLAFDTQGYKRAGEYEFSPDKAKALLAQAGWTPGAGGKLQKGGQPLKLRMLASEGLFPGDVSIAEICQRAFQQVGIEAEIRKVEGGAYWGELRRERKALDFDVAFFGFNPSNASGLYHLESLFKSNADDNGKLDVWNIGRYRNARVDELLARANATPDLAGQNALLGEVQKIVWDEAPYVWLHVNENVTAVRKGVTGVEVWPIVFTIPRRAGA